MWREFACGLVPAMNLAGSLVQEAVKAVAFHGIRMKKHGFHCLFSLSVGCTLASGCPGWKECLLPSWACSGSAEADLCFTKGLKLKIRNDFRGAAGTIALPSKEGVWSEPTAEVPWLMPARSSVRTECGSDVMNIFHRRPRVGTELAGLCCSCTSCAVRTLH